MEELQSTEILDREILEDARKKALRLLNQATEIIESQNARWEKKIADEIKKLNKKYSDQIESEIQSIMARLPVDKLRLKIEKIENFLKSAVNEWYTSQSQEQIIKLLSNELIKKLNFCKDDISKEDNFTAVAAGLEKDEIEAIIKSVNRYTLFISHSSLQISHSSFPSITLISNDIRIIASVEKTIDYILHDKREELTAVLLGIENMGSV